MVVTATRRALEGLLLETEPAAETASEEAPRAGRADGPTILRHGDWHLYATPLADTGTGDVVAEFERDDGAPLPVRRDEACLHVPFDLDEAFANYVGERWTASGSGSRRLSGRQLAVFYRAKRVIPRAAQLRARRALIRWQGMPSFPRWPLDDGVERLLKLHCRVRLESQRADELRFRWFWPEPHRAAIVLSHDVEGDDGIRLALELADLEESLGFRSAFNFGAWYDIDPGVLRELTSRGFEIGVHSIVHDRSLFSSRAEFERQLPLIRDLAERLGAVGFRSPATHRVNDWLGELPFEYDGTVPHSDPYEPQPGGCCSLWPFFVGDLVELPYSLPQDHTLLTLLGHRTPKLWLDAAGAIVARHGLVQCLTHPDPGYVGDPDKRAIYREFLVGMGEHDGVWRALPRDVARWWRGRVDGTAEGLSVGRAVRSGDDPLGVTLLAG